jgi:CRP-like cAMP-binding protein
MQNGIHSVSEKRLACPDCPAFHACVPSELLPGPMRACGFESLRIDARTPLPDRWHEGATMALVRRGIVVRQRVDARGRAVTIDAAGAGTVVPIDPERAARIWAVTDAVLCLLTPKSAEQWCRQSGADVAKVMAIVLDRVERIAEARGRNTVMGRTASLLCVLSDTLTPSPRSHVPSELPQRTMAALAAIRQESMCRVLKRLVKREAIRRDERGIHILDRAALEAL